MRVAGATPDPPPGSPRSPRHRKGRPMKLRALTSLVLIMAGVSLAHAQGSVPGSVTGVVTDASTRAPLENATVALRSVSDSTKVVAHSITSRDGKFQFTNVPLGTYVLECMLLGHKSYRSTSFALGESSPRKALGSIPLASSVLVLREVEVQTQRETFNPSLDRRRHTVDHQLVAQPRAAAAPSGRGTPTPRGTPSSPPATAAPATSATTSSHSRARRRTCWPRS